MAFGQFKKSRSSQGQNGNTTMQQCTMSCDLVYQQPQCIEREHESGSSYAGINHNQGTGLTVGSRLNTSGVDQDDQVRMRVLSEVWGMGGVSLKLKKDSRNRDIGSFRSCRVRGRAKLREFLHL